MENIRISDELFGELLPYIKNDNITDINWNGTQLWIDDLEIGRYCDEKVKLSQHFIEQFSQRIANEVHASFNKSTPQLEAEVNNELRISILHEYVAMTGRSISIRKAPAMMRLNKEKMKTTGYCPDFIMNFLINCVKAKMNMIICGLPGAGKTELLKTLTYYIPPNQRVITIEDNLEIHYGQINTGKDCVELKVDRDFEYPAAIKACLRQLPEWILLSEARSVEVKYLLESMSTGTHCLTTLHTDNVTKIPDRIKNMMPETSRHVDNDIFSFIDVGIQVVKEIDASDAAIKRRISQIALYSRDELEDKNELMVIYDEKRTMEREVKFPFNILNKFEMAGIKNPFTPYEGNMQH